MIYETNCSNRIFRNFFSFLTGRKNLLALGLFKIYYAIAKSSHFTVLLLLRQVKEFPFFVIMYFIMFKIILFIVECIFSFIAIVSSGLQVEREFTSRRVSLKDCKKYFMKFLSFMAVDE